MENFADIKLQTGLIANFPIFPQEQAVTEEEKFVSNNSRNFRQIFDAAAMGQYLGGVDPRNNSSNTVGFVNETCVIKYNKYDIFFESVNGIEKPFLKVEGKTYPIFNLHIHSKNLKKFIRHTDFFDIVVCVGPNDKEIVHDTICYAKKNIIGYRNIYLISYDPHIKIPDTITIDEKIFPFQKHDIERHYINSDRTGWYLQQLLKLYAGKTIPGILENYLVLDADTYFLRPTRFIIDGKYMFTVSDEYNSKYFEHMNRLNKNLSKSHPLSGISHHMILNTRIIDEMMNTVGEPFWKKFINAITKETNFSGTSEYEIYFTYMLLYHKDKMTIRKLHWKNCSSFTPEDYDFISCHWYLRK